ncbi:hypothetical protein HDV05_006705 [Chytridiales sp. JEL 0842]|nr:hypothetical protein HDV05_006705 [Chytridiales sp. JEL 0842]
MTKQIGEGGAPTTIPTPPATPRLPLRRLKRFYFETSDDDHTPQPCCKRLKWEHSNHLSHLRGTYPPQDPEEEDQEDLDALFLELEQEQFERIDFPRFLPPELTLAIFENLDPSTLLLAGSASRRWRIYAHSPQIWKHKCIQLWKGKEGVDKELRVHALVDYTTLIYGLSLKEMLWVLQQRGVEFQVLNTRAQRSMVCVGASWPSSNFVDASCWHWFYDSERENVFTHDGAVGPTQPAPATTTWLRRLVCLTTPSYSPLGTPPKSLGKWGASFWVSVKDARRSRITYAELTSLEWSVERFFPLDEDGATRVREVGRARFESKGRWRCTLSETEEWWRITRDGRVQVSFFQSLEVRRRGGWGWEMVGDGWRYVSVGTGKMLGLDDYSGFL